MRFSDRIKRKIARSLRVYEYTNQDGQTFWSFERLPATVTTGHRMVLSDRIGTQFDNYVNQLRVLRRVREMSGDED